ncbi:hypothetical protein OIU79_006376, partial [Salix purpurea]
MCLSICSRVISSLNRVSNVCFTIFGVWAAMSSLSLC